MNSLPWYTIKNIDLIDSPALAVYPARISENIKRMIHIAGSPAALRPHIKTYKMAEVVKMQMENGIQKFKCATISEAEMLAGAGVRDVLLAYQPVGPKAVRLLQLAQKFPQTTFAALVDNHVSAEHLAGIFERNSRTLELYLDLDVGMHRTGISAAKAFALYRFCRELKGVEPAGLHVYDGHFRDPDPEKRKKSCDESFQSIQLLASKIEELQGREPLIVAGGTPTFPVHAQRTEAICSPGTCLLWDWGYHKKFRDLDFQFAALVISRIISKIGNNLICLDLGHKSIAAENPLPRVHFLNLPESRQLTQSEEHLVLEVENNNDFEVGMAFYGIPLHICPTCALYEKAHVVENNMVSKEWKVISRDRKITV